jgi:PhzF family phenazine biosynthesis protein
MMAKIINAFTDSKNGGNPAGLVINPSNLTINQMIDISNKLNVSETAFVFNSANADYKLRFFSPTTEVDLCGHATIASFYNLAEEGKISNNLDKITLKQETNVGILPIEIYFKNNKVNKVMMIQAKLQTIDIELNYDNIANALGINKDEIIKLEPTQIVSTGIYTLPINVSSISALKNLNPNFKEIKRICKEKNCGSIHVFTFETIEKSSVYHSRNFAPCYGINEDPVTGTANGAVSSYIVKNNMVKGTSFICEQGDIIGRPGRVLVDFKNDTVKVGGRAKLVKKVEIKV